MSDTEATAAAPDGGQTQETKPEVATTVAGKKSKATGNLIADTAVEIENLTKPKALKEADALAGNIEANYFKLGGVLAVIKENTWFDGFESFGLYVYEKFGFKERKADYLIGIYQSLVNNLIPWEKVGHLGWTKLKDLAPILTLDNVDEWVDKASKLTVLELQATLNAKPATEAGGTTNATDGIETMKFKFKADQKAVVETAIGKAKAELSTEFDTVAIESICANYVSGGQLVNPSGGEITMAAVLEKFDLETLLTAVSEKYPEYDIKVGPKGSLEEAAAT